MGGKRGRKQNKDTPNPKRRPRKEDFAEKDMDDEIDAFHKQRDVVPLDVDGNVGASDEDNEEPVFDFEDDNDDDDEIEDDSQLTGLAAKIARQQKFLRQKIGGFEDEMHDDAEEEEEKKAIWGRKKNVYYNADNVDYELQSSDEESPAEEEAEVLRLQREKAQSLSMEDFGLEDVDQDESVSDDEPTLEEILVKGKAPTKPHSEKGAEGDTGMDYVEIKKDLNALSKEEQMDVVYNSAPELVGLLSELNDALYQLESKVSPLISKVKGGQSFIKGEMSYLEVKELLLITYCQAIGFYLLLKAEGQPVRDHPVITRLVEIKNLLDKIKELDKNLPSETEVILDRDNGVESAAKLIKESAVLTSEPVSSDHELSLISSKTQETALHPKTANFTKTGLSADFEKKHRKSNLQNDQVGMQAMEMLKIRASLEEKLKQRGIFSSIAPTSNKAQKHPIQGVNRQLETLDDFDDELIDNEGDTRGLSNGHAGALQSSNLSQLGHAKVNKPKVISGDEDLPKRDDIGERRRKHELRVLAKAGIEPIDDVSESEDANVEDGVETEDLEDEFYKEVKYQRAAKLSTKAALYSRNPDKPSLPETEVLDGKRQISYQMEKNRGLTRARKKLTKNPRKKYKLKHQKAVVRRQGQVRAIKRPSGPYGGEASGINAGISRSIRFKN